MKEPQIQVGILAGKSIKFSLHGRFQCGRKIYSGDYQAEIAGNYIFIDGEKEISWLFNALDAESVFELKEVIIGIHFHWERKENQVFQGNLRLIKEDTHVRAINQLGVEDYLSSVISSEMSANASPELLKAHAVISRSWLLRPIMNEEITVSNTVQVEENQLIKWYERDAHHHFDVCADDHCQRYQGITRATNPQVKIAIAETAGMVLKSDGKICDARYYKSCGGATETFDTCWADRSFAYLQKIADRKDSAFKLKDLSKEDYAVEWIRSVPESFCNTKKKSVLTQVLNDYDQETTDFYRWKVRYSQDEITALIEKKSKLKFGRIIDLIPLKRGTSGRISLLKIVGSELVFTVGKELEIRKWLSESHLYSSAFIVEKEEIENGFPRGFVLKGAGWGHGVGLCQIGAAVMGEEGYSFTEILTHYFKNAIVEKIY